MAQKTLESYKKVCDQPLAFVFNIESKLGKEHPLDANVYEQNNLEKATYQLQWRVEADKCEIIVINDLIKEISGNQSDGGSGYVKGMKTWSNSFDIYLEKLSNAERQLLSGEMQKNPERLRLLKEAIINFPQNLIIDTAGSLEQKFITADIMNLMTTVFKRKMDTAAFMTNN